MGHVRFETEISAPVEGVFDAARDIDLHLVKRAAETAAAGEDQPAASAAPR